MQINLHHILTVDTRHLAVDVLYIKQYAQQVLYSVE